MNLLKRLFHNESRVYWQIEDWTPKLKIPEYDRLYSLCYYLERLGFNDELIIKTAKDKHPYSFARRQIMMPSGRVTMSEAYFDGKLTHEATIPIWTIQGDTPVATIEWYFICLVYQIGTSLYWNMKTKKPDPHALKQYIKILSYDNYPAITSMINMRTASCFAADILRLGWGLEKTVDYGISHIEMNAKSTNNPIGNLYHGFGPKQTETIIRRLIEAAYKLDKFSVRWLLRKKTVH